MNSGLFIVPRQAMGNSEHFKELIEKKLASSGKTNHSQWSIGVTNQPDEIRKRQGNPAGWCQFKTDSLPTAKMVEQYYLKSFPANSDQRMSSGSLSGKIDQRKDPFIIIYPTEEAYY